MSYLLEDLQFAIWQNNESHGFHEGDRNFGLELALVHSEVSEALEEWREGHGLTEIYFNPEKPTKPEGIPVEMADTVIRCLDYFEENDLDAETVIRQKMAYNATRPYKHGKIA